MAGYVAGFVVEAFWVYWEGGLFEGCAGIPFGCGVRVVGGLVRGVGDGAGGLLSEVGVGGCPVLQAVVVIVIVVEDGGVLQLV